MHQEILTKEQIRLLPLLKSFSKNFGLVGGTAIALHVGHRRSIDFDLFSYTPFKNIVLRSKIKKFTDVDAVFVDRDGEFTLVSGGVKITFFQYPFEIAYGEFFDTIIKTPDLLTLAAMKAYALGRRAKWKDYVDLYFIIKEHYSIMDITKKAKKIFGHEFNEKIFRTQLSYFKDINYDERIEFLPGFETEEGKIKKALVDFSLS